MIMMQKYIGYISPNRKKTTFYAETSEWVAGTSRYLAQPILFTLMKFFC